MPQYQEYFHCFDWSCSLAFAAVPSAVLRNWEEDGETHNPPFAPLSLYPFDQIASLSYPSYPPVPSVIKVAPVKSRCVQEQRRYLISLFSDVYFFNLCEQASWFSAISCCHDGICVRECVAYRRGQKYLKAFKIPLGMETKRNAVFSTYLLKGSLML